MTGEASTTPVPLTPESSYSRDRIMAFSDGVYAIAITLLGFGIVPNIAHTVTGPQLVRELLNLAPELVAYFLSFLVIGRFWDTHRVFFRHIMVGDARVSWINLLILLWITLIPATAALLGSHWQEPAALSLYALNLLLCILSYWLLWRSVSSTGYVREEGLHAASHLHLDQYAGLSALGYALVIPTAFLSPPLALALIFLTTTLARTISRRIFAPSAPRQRGAAPSPHAQDAHVDDEE